MASRAKKKRAKRVAGPPGIQRDLFGGPDTMDPRQIQTHEPLRSIFPINPSTLEAIEAHMAAHGYQKGHPIELGTWAGQAAPVVVDGHTRLKAALAQNLDSIPVVVKSFESEDDAVEYAKHNQRNRRNLSDAELLSLVEDLDERSTRGGDRRSEDFKGSREPMKEGTGRSAETTAKALGTSASKVKKARTIIDHGTDEDKQDVEEGNKSLNQVAGEIRARRKQEEPPVITEQPIVQPASPPVGGMIGDTDELLAAGKKFGTFYISIPWDKYVPPGVNVKGNGEDVWTQKRLAHLPVDELAAAKSHVHIWVPSQFIKVAILLLEGWRFEYKGLFLCTRPPKKRGAFWRENHDFLLLGVRGRLKFQGDFETNLLATADSGNGKPEQVRNLIESVSPPPRIEFFASETVEGWTTWRPTGS